MATDAGTEVRSRQPGPRMFAGRRLAAAWLAAVLAAGAMTGPLAAQTAQQIQSAAEQAIRKLDLQTELPREPRPWTVPWHFDMPTWVLWAVIALAIVILVFVFRDSIPLWNRGWQRARTTDAASPGAASAGDDMMALAAADELAAAGRFADAMHLLLLQGLTEIRRRLDQQFADSLTSREILRGSTLSNKARASLRDIVGRVELTHFGHYPAAGGDYAACRASFQALSQSLVGIALA
jgi:hypothetical protein